MIQSIRGRIAALSLLLLLVLVVFVGWLVLGGLSRALAEVADGDLRAELESLVGEVADRRLSALLAVDRAADVAWGDVAFDLRDALDARARGEGEPLLYEILRGDARIAESASLAGTPLPDDGAPVERGGLVFRDSRDPRANAGGARLRMAEVSLGPYRLRLARSLAPFQRIESTMRAQVLAVVVGICLLGAAGSWLVAARGLAPVRRLAQEAERLRTLAQGTLARSGRGDEIDELAAVLNRLLDRVRREVERQRQFTADAAHEIRTPLAAMRGHLELLLDQAPSGWQHALGAVIEEIDRLTRLVNRLLLLEKLEDGADTGRRERLDLLGLARGLAEHLRVVAAEQGIELEARGEAAPVDADPEQLRQVLLNLLDNAFRHTPPGGRVWVDVRLDRDRVRVAVGDTGPGIPPDRRDRVFDRFSSDRSRAQAGSGLGLPIARAIARAHGGDLRAEAAASGALFVLDLPGPPG